MYLSHSAAMEEGVAQDAPNILVIGGAGSGKSSLIRFETLLSHRAGNDLLTDIKIQASSGETIHW